MPDKSEFADRADEVGGMRAGGAAARRAWSKPAVQRIPLERTLNGSHFYPDVPTDTSNIP